MCPTLPRLKMNMSKNFARKLIRVIAFTSLGALFLSCKTQKPRPLNEITIALGAPPFSLDPLMSTDATGMRIVSLTHQGLVRIGSDLKAQADLANTWSVSGKNYTFFIKKNNRFSDGTPLRCEHLTKSIEAYQSKKTPFKRAFAPIIEKSCELNGSQIVLKLKLEAPSAKFLLSDLPVLKIMGPNKIGSGAFVLKDKKPTEYTFEPNQYYESNAEHSLKIFFLKDDFSRFLKMYKGEIDVAPNSIPFEKVPSFSGTDFKVIERPSLSTSYILINFKNPKLSSLMVRKALYTGIGIPDLVKNRFDNHVTLAKSLLSPEHPYFSKDLLMMGHMPEKLEEKPGLLTLKTSNSRQSIETGKIIAQKLRDLGLPVQVQSFEWGTFYRDVKSGNYDLALMKWVGVIDPDQYNIAFHSKEFPPGRNRGYYSNESVDKLLNEARTVIDAGRRTDLYKKVQNIIFEDLAIIPLWHENQIHIVHPRIENYKVNPMGDFSSLISLSVKKEVK